MKATELRIGNYHNYLVKDPIDVRKQWNEVCQIDAHDLLSLSKEPDVRYQPIPLTEEWLLKFGFTLMKDTTPYNYRLHKNKSFCYIRYGTYGIIENGIENFEKGFNGLFIGNKFIRVIKYVHDLQNLYFALSNEELTL